MSFGNEPSPEVEEPPPSSLEPVGMGPEAVGSSLLSLRHQVQALGRRLFCRVALQGLLIDLTMLSNYFCVSALW